jgi:hypothetical protein
MDKHPAAFSILPLTICNAIAGWFSQKHGRTGSRQLRKAIRAREEIVSELNAQILYDIGESDCRPLRSPIWDNNAYRLLIDGIMSRAPFDFDSRR